MESLSEAETIRALRRLEKRWPVHLMLFVHDYGVLLLLDKETWWQQHQHDGIKGSGVVATFSIPSDSGQERVHNEQ